MRCFIILIIFSLVCVDTKSQVPDNEYETAISAICSDTVLLRNFCSNGSEISLDFFEKYNYLPLYYFNHKVASGRKIDLSTANDILSKVDKKVIKEKDRISYTEVSPEIRDLFIDTDDPCAIICFDRMRDGFLAAEVTYYLEGESWDEIRNHQTSFFLLFDFNMKPFQYHAIEIER
ncbi:MAG: hypothetical protein RLQ12_24095 [Cyclobacteriaceae bacterium]